MEKTTFQELCELAEREVSLGLADERLWNRAMSEANDVEAHARQIYWRARATALRDEAERSGSEMHLAELRAELNQQEKRMRSRKRRNGWFWAGACFAGLVGAYVFPRLAYTAHARGSSSFYPLSALGVACLALAVIAYTASRYHTHVD